MTDPRIERPLGEFWLCDSCGALMSCFTIGVHMCPCCESLNVHRVDEAHEVVRILADLTGSPEIVSAAMEGPGVVGRVARAFMAATAEARERLGEGDDDGVRP